MQKFKFLACILLGTYVIYCVELLASTVPHLHTFQACNIEKLGIWPGINAKF